MTIMPMSIDFQEGLEQEVPAVERSVEISGGVWQTQKTAGGASGLKTNGRHRRVVPPASGIAGMRGPGGGERRATPVRRETGKQTHSSGDGVGHNGQ